MDGLMVGVQQPLSRSPGGLHVASYSVQFLLDIIGYLARDLWMLSRAARVACWLGFPTPVTTAALTPMVMSV